jgi:hypothetical protein
MAGQIERFHPQAPKELDRYLIPTEQIIFLIRRHWIVLFEPIASVVAGLAVLAFVAQRVGGPLATVALVLWLLLLLRLLGTLLDWYRRLFLATDRRLMQVSGIVTRQVDIMPMSKVTDMRYDRTLTGQLFGYGVYILESAGQPPRPARRFPSQNRNRLGGAAPDVLVGHLRSSSRALVRFR